VQIYKENSNRVQKSASKVNFKCKNQIQKSISIAKINWEAEINSAWQG